MKKLTSNKKSNSTIYLDTREKDGRIYSMFTEQTSFKVEKMQLDVGDIVFDSCCIERKNARDLLASVKSERFWLNIKDIQENFATYMLWIDASEEDITSAINWSCKRGFKYSLDSYDGTRAALAIMNVPVVQFSKIENATDYFMRIFKKIDSGKKSSMPTGIKKRGVSIHKRRVQSISRINGIGDVTAELLLDQHGTIEKLIQSSKKDKRRVMTMINEFFCKP